MGDSFFRHMTGLGWGFILLPFVSIAYLIVYLKVKSLFLIIPYIGLSILAVVLGVLSVVRLGDPYLGVMGLLLSIDALFYIFWFLPAASMVHAVVRLAKVIGSWETARIKSLVLPIFLLLIVGVYLIEMDASISADDSLRSALENNDADALRRFDLTSEEADRRFGSSVLFDAVQTGKLDIVRVCLEKGADVNKRNYRDETPLSSLFDIEYKARTWRKNAPEPLADIDPVNEDIILLLVEHGVEISMEDMTDISLCPRGKEIQGRIRALFLEGKWDRDGETADTIIEWAIRDEDEDFMAKLLEKPVDQNRKNRWLFSAIYLNVERIVELLKKHGARIESGEGDAGAGNAVLRN